MERLETACWRELFAPRKLVQAIHLVVSTIGTAPNKRLATDISKWNRKQAELRANESAVDAAPDVTRQSDSGHPVATNTVSETRALSAMNLNGPSQAKLPSYPKQKE